MEEENDPRLWAQFRGDVRSRDTFPAYTVLTWKLQGWMLPSSTTLPRKGFGGARYHRGSSWPQSRICQLHSASLSPMYIWLLNSTWGATEHPRSERKSSIFNQCMLTWVCSPQYIPVLLLGGAGLGSLPVKIWTSLAWHSESGVSVCVSGRRKANLSVYLKVGWLFTSSKDYCMEDFSRYLSGSETLV